MNKKHKFLILGASVLYVLYHLVTLTYSPLPWFDEVSFASITNSFIKSRTYYQEAIMINTKGENSMYGPVYFALQAVIVKLTGWNIFTFRISNLLFGIANLYLVYRICVHFGFRALATLLTVSIVALDPSFNQFLHSGRMDNITNFLFLVSFLVFVKTENNNQPKNIGRALFIGILLATAMLTNPRILFSFSFYGAYFIYELVIGKRETYLKIFVKYLAILVSLAAVYYLWIYFKFGSVSNFVYKNYTSNQIMKNHIGFSWSELRFNTTMIFYGFTFFCLLLLLVTKKAGENIRLILFTIPVIISFLFLVGGAVAGRYYGMIVPFTTILFVGVTIHIFQNKLLAAPTWLLVSMLTIGFIFKGLYVFATLRQRDPFYNEKMLSKYITPNTNIAGDYAFFYLAKHNNCFFQGIRENGPADSIINYYTRNKYDYFIFNKNNPAREYFLETALKGRYELVTLYENKPSTDIFSKAINKMGYRITEDYSCYIYKYNGAK